MTPGRDPAAFEEVRQVKYRDVVIYTGERFTVPQGIQRIDHRATHGWQLRYGGSTKLFSDGAVDGSAAAALAKATKELLARIAKMPAPSKLQKEPSGNKSSDLPVGISGPVVRLRPGASVRDCSFSVSLPRWGESPRRSSVHIGTENTYSAERYHEALAKAIEMRRKAERAYERAATRAMRESSADLRSMLPARAARATRAGTGAR